MSYYREDEVATLIVNAAQWSGDGASVRGCGGIWGRIMREVFRSSAPVVTLGVTALRTKAALARMPDDLRAALWAFHTSSLTFAMQSKDILRVSKATYHRRLLEAHPLFIAEIEIEAVSRNAAARELATIMAAAAPAPEVPFIRPGTPDREPSPGAKPLARPVKNT